MKQATGTLPPTEMSEKLGDFENHLVVVERGWKRDEHYNTKFGERDTIIAAVHVRIDDAWVAIGETPIFFKTVIGQLLDAGRDDDFGGKLVRGTERVNEQGRVVKNPNEWQLAPVKGAEAELLDSFTTSF